MNHSGADVLVAQIDQAMTGLAELLAEPALAHFESIHPAFEALEKVFARKAGLDAAFAWAADMNEAGLKVGSSRSTDYLMQRLDISRAEATARLRRGKALYDPPVEPEPEPDDDPVADDDATRAAAREKAERERKAQAAARGREAAGEKRAVIDEELRNLSPHATPGFNELLDRALEFAQSNAVGVVRHWLREQVRLANRSVSRLHESNRAFNRRYVSLSEPDEHGGVRLSGYLPADMAAALSEALNPARSNILDGTALKTTEGMSMGKKRAHLLTAMCRNFLNDKTLNLKGIGSIVVSMTLDELENMRVDDVFPTNTGHLLDPFALIRLGEARSDGFVIHAQDGQPLHAGTGKRTAGVMQRIALFASELVCSHPDCDRPMSECQAHHLIPAARGGPTSISNLTWLCWGHHRDNNDDRDPVSPFGWADRDEESGRVGHRRRAGAPVMVNGTPAARRSGAAKVRARRGEASVV
ncbi:HNH endonuclease signature motif containing protein [Corynebacterium doosanense]|nr:HNH endonuclease signature motif containing protein [Corynebacterium doosanense]